MDSIDAVLKTLANSKVPLKAGDISEQTGMDKKEVDKVIKKLVSEDKIFSPKRCFYATK